MGTQRRILLISGSVRAASTNSTVLRTVQAVVAADDVDAVLYDGLGDLPHFNPDDDVDPLDPAVADLRAQIDAADAVLFCTPEYAGALPGSFKNLLDWTVGGIEINDTWAGWINASTAPGGAAGAHAELRTVLGYVGATIVDPACVHVPVPRDAMGDDGMVVDPDIREQLAKAVAALVG